MTKDTSKSDIFVIHSYTNMNRKSFINDLPIPNTTKKTNSSKTICNSSPSCVKHKDEKANCPATNLRFDSVSSDAIFGGEVDG